MRPLRGSVLRRVAAVCVILAGATAVSAAPPPALELQDAWIRWVPSVVPNTALYGVLVNHGAVPVALIGGATPAAKMCKPMTTVKQDTGSPSGPVITMEPVEALSVPAHGTLMLEPGGDHLMVMGLAVPLRLGTEVQLTLRFDGAAPLTVTVPVLEK